MDKRLQRGSLVVLLVLFGPVVGCPDEEPAQDDDSGPADDDDTAGADCEEGFVLDDGECVPDHCGRGPWGHLDVGPDTIYVAAGETRGDGSEGSPFATIQEGLGAAAAGGLVAVARGSYEEDLVVGAEHAGIELAGRCLELVEVKGGGEGVLAAIQVDVGAGATFDLSGMTITGGAEDFDEPPNIDAGGLVVFSGVVTARELDVVANRYHGAFVSGESSELTLEDCSVRDSLPHPVDLDVGRGIGVKDGAHLMATGCVLSGNTEFGLLVGGTGALVDLQNTDILDTSPRGDGAYGAGIMVLDHAMVRAESCLIEGNSFAGIYSTAFEDPLGDPENSVELIDVDIRDTSPSRFDPTWDDLAGFGISVDVGSLFAQDCRLDNNSVEGLRIMDAGTRATLVDVDVTNTRIDPAGEFGWGVSVGSGAYLYMTGGVLDGNAAGLYGGGSSNGVRTEVHLHSVVIRNSEERAIGVTGSAAVTGEVWLTAEDCLLDNNRGAGVVVVHPATVVDLTRVEITNTRPRDTGTNGNGIYAANGATVTATDCTLSNNREVGVSARDPYTVVTLDSVTVHDTHPNDVGEFGYGLEAGAGATLEATGCALARNHRVGILVDGPSTVVTLTETAVSDTRWLPENTVAVGLLAQNWATVEADLATFMGTDGPGIVLNGYPTVTCSGCDLLDNAFAGAAVLSGGHLELDGGSRVSGTTSHGQAGGTVGVYAWAQDNPVSLVLDDVTIEEHTLAALWLSGNGSYTVASSTLVGGTSLEIPYPEPAYGSRYVHGDGIVALDGIAAWDGTSGLNVADTAINDAFRAGVFMDGSSAVFQNNSFGSNDINVIWQDGEDQGEPVGIQDIPDTVLDSGAPYPLDPIEFSMVPIDTATQYGG